MESLICVFCFTSKFFCKINLLLCVVVIHPLLSHLVFYWMNIQSIHLVYSRLTFIFQFFVYFKLCCWNILDSLPGSSIHGILQAGMLEWVAIPFSRGSSRPRDRTQVCCIAGRFFTFWAKMWQGLKVISPPSYECLAKSGLSCLWRSKWILSPPEWAVCKREKEPGGNGKSGHE